MSPLSIKTAPSTNKSAGTGRIQIRIGPYYWDTTTAGGKDWAFYELKLPLDLTRLFSDVNPQLKARLIWFQLKGILDTLLSF